jgi:hypothetical protein
MDHYKAEDAHQNEMAERSYKRMTAEERDLRMKWLEDQIATFEFELMNLLSEAIHDEQGCQDLPLCSECRAHVAEKKASQ